MSHSLKLLTVLSAGALLGCSQFSLTSSQRETAAQAQAKPPAPSRVAAAYGSASPRSELAPWWTQGRTAQEQGQLTLALEHYARVLRADPAHVGALNATAVIYAQTDRLDQAIHLFQQALALQPRAAHLFNNLGYALLLAGRLNEAQSALQQAAELNPGNPTTHKNLEVLAQARARGLQIAAPAGGAATDSPVARQDPAGQASLVAVASNVYQLRDPVAVRPAASVPSRTPGVVRAEPLAAATGLAIKPGAPEKAQQKGLLSGVRLEVANGVGIRHLARRTSERLAPLGLLTVRLTNQAGFRQATTELQYRHGQQEAAEALARELPQRPRVLLDQSLAGAVQLRLVLGHDGTGQAVIGWLDTPQAPTPGQDLSGPMPVALSPVSGWCWG